MSSDEYIAPPFFSIISALFVLSAATLFGRIRDVFYFLLHPYKRSGNKGYAPIRDPTEDFYMRRMYGRIVDCWNRPICSAPDAWMDVMERTRVKDTTGVDFAEIAVTGAKRRCLNLASYNYLGFAASDPYCTPRVLETIEELGVSSCSPRSHGGTTKAHVELEQLVAEYLGVEAAITYGMGFATNSSTIPTLVSKGCLIMSDALNHSSIVAGTRQSGAKVKVFRHNDARHLRALLRQSIAEGQPRSHRPWKKILVIVEGVYSMEGEACNLREIVEVAKEYKAYVYLDEAHSIGALGPTGRGCCEHWGVDPRDIDVMMGTFTKSFGSCGGYIAGRREVIDYLFRHSPSHLYACSMAPGCVKQVTAALEVIMGRDGSDRGARKVAQLHDNANYVRSRLLTMGLDVLGSWNSPVMPIMTYSAAKMVALSRDCLARNLAMVIVGFPATPVLLTRTRICISAAHSREDLDWALDQLAEVADLCMLRYRTKNLYQRLELDLKEHVTRHFGAEAAERATIANLASGAFDPRAIVHRKQQQNHQHHHRTPSTTAATLRLPQPLREVTRQAATATPAPPPTGSRSPSDTAEKDQKEQSQLGVTTAGGKGQPGKTRGSSAGKSVKGAVEPKEVVVAATAGGGGKRRNGMVAGMNGRSLSEPHHAKAFIRVDGMAGTLVMTK